MERWFLDVSSSFVGAPRSQFLPRWIGLFFIIPFDICTSYFMTRKKIMDNGKYLILLDMALVTVGILLFHENLQIGLLVAPFYLGCYLNYFFSKSRVSLLYYWLIVILPISLHFEKVDFFSVDYFDFSSIIAVFTAHLIPYLWLYLIKRKSYGEQSVRYSWTYA